jgi:hypothetical protein
VPKAAGYSDSRFSCGAAPALAFSDHQIHPMNRSSDLGYPPPPIPIPDWRRLERWSSQVIPDWRVLHQFDFNWRRVQRVGSRSRAMSAISATPVPTRPFSHLCCKYNHLCASTLGSPLRDAWVTLAWPLGDAWVTQSQPQSQQAEGRKLPPVLTKG